MNSTRGLCGHSSSSAASPFGQRLSGALPLAWMPSSRHISAIISFRRACGDEWKFGTAGGCFTVAKRNSRCKHRSLKLILLLIICGTFLTFNFAPVAYNERSLHSSSRSMLDDVGWIWERHVSDPRYLSDLNINWRRISIADAKKNGHYSGCGINRKYSTIEVILKFEEISMETAREFSPLFSNILSCLYDKEILSEEAILTWAQEKEGADESDKIFSKQSEQFIKWLREASEEEDEEDE